MRHKGKLTHFESSKGWLISLHNSKVKAAKYGRTVEAEKCTIDNPECESPQEEDLSELHVSQDQTTKMELSGTAPQSATDALEMAHQNYPDSMKQFMRKEGSAPKSKTDQVAVDN